MLVEAEMEFSPMHLAPRDASQALRWLKESFANRSCREVTLLRSVERTIFARVALSTRALPEQERQLIEGHGSDVRLLRALLERMFVGRGAGRVIGAPELKSDPVMAAP